MVAPKVLVLVSGRGCGKRYGVFYASHGVPAYAHDRRRNHHHLEGLHPRTVAVVRIHRYGVGARLGDRYLLGDGIRHKGAVEAPLIGAPPDLIGGRYGLQEEPCVVRSGRVGFDGLHRDGGGDGRAVERQSVVLVGVVTWPVVGGTRLETLDLLRELVFVHNHVHSGLFRGGTGARLRSPTFGAHCHIESVLQTHREGSHAACCPVRGSQFHLPARRKHLRADGKLPQRLHELWEGVHLHVPRPVVLMHP